MSDRTFTGYVVQETSTGELVAGLHQLERQEVPPGEVLIRVQYSSLNYKDAMAATGDRGIAKTLPHVPGIDAAGIVEESNDPRFTPGMAVFSTGHELGVERNGGWAEFVTVPGDWVFPLSEEFNAEDAMTIGTAGFTAAQCVHALVERHVTPQSGPIVVTGATGGVGSLAVMILSQLGFHVVAVTGKSEQAGWLKSIGASEVAGRDLLSDEKKRPLLSAKFAGGIDTVGGEPLTNLCKMILHRGTVACCGLTAGSKLGLTVYPFILRGIALIGIDSAWCPDADRQEIWKKLAGEWKPHHLSAIRRVVPLSKIGPEVEKTMNGNSHGRVVVDVQSE